MNKNWFSIKKLQQSIWGIGEFGHFQEVISYLIVGNKKALLFDTGMGIGNIKEEIGKITSLPITVINSHCHFDHIGDNWKFNDILLFDNEWAKNVAKNGVTFSQLHQHMPEDGFYQNPPNDFRLQNYSIKPFQWNKLVKEGHRIDIDPFTFQVLHTPGHSPDGICLYEENSGFLFSGDTFYPGPIYLQLEESQLEDFKKTIEKLTELKNIQKIFPAHNDFEVAKKDLESLDIFLKSKNLNEMKGQRICITERVSLMI